MGVTFSDLIKRRDLTLERSQDRHLVPQLRAWNKGWHDELAAFFTALAQGEVIERVDLQRELDNLTARDTQPWNLEYSAYWSGGGAATRWLLSNWEVSASTG